MIQLKSLRCRISHRRKRLASSAPIARFATVSTKFYPAIEKEGETTAGPSNVGDIISSGIRLQLYLIPNLPGSRSRWSLNVVAGLALTPIQEPLAGRADSARSSATRRSRARTASRGSTRSSAPTSRTSGPPATRRLARPAGPARARGPCRPRQRRVAGATRRGRTTAGQGNLVPGHPS